MINRIYGLAQGGWEIFENYSVESDRGDKSGVNETADQ